MRLIRFSLPLHFYYSSRVVPNSPSLAVVDHNPTYSWNQLGWRADWSWMDFCSGDFDPFENHFLVKRMRSTRALLRIDELLDPFVTDTNYALTRCQIDKCWRSEGHLFIIINVSYITSGLLLKIWHEDMESSLLKNLPRYLPRGYEARENGIVWHGRNWVVFLTSFRNKPNWTNGGFLWDFPKSTLQYRVRETILHDLHDGKSKTRIPAEETSIISMLPWHTLLLPMFILLPSTKTNNNSQ